MKKLFYYSSLYTASSVLVKSISFLVILFLGKYFSAKDYAIFGLLYSMHQGVSTFAIAGINESVIGFLKDLKTKVEKNNLYSKVLFATLPSTFLVFCITIIFYLIYLKKQNPDLLFIYFIFTIFSGLLLSFSIFNSKIFRLKENHFASLLYLSFPQILIFLCGGILVNISSNINYFFVGSFFSLLIFLGIIKLIYSDGNLPLKYGNITKKIIINSFPYYTIAILGWLGGYGNNFIINIFFGSLEIAAYTFIYTLSGALLMISNALNQVWAPRFYNSFSEELFVELERKNYHFYGILAVLLGIAVSLIVQFYPIVLKLIGGNLVYYSEMRLELYLILASYIIYTPIWQYRIHFYANSMGRELMKITALSSIAGLLSMVLFIKFFDGIGIYYGFFSMMLINLIVISFVARTKWKIMINWFGVLTGCIISLITLLITELNGNLIYSILFTVFSASALLIYIKMTKIKLR